jgi:uncharacterized Zn-finger protein
MLKKARVDTSNVTCDLCQKQYSERSAYLRHVREVHKGAKRATTSQVFQCTFINCDAFYTSAQNLQYHIQRDHHNVKHTCDTCGAEFKTPANLITHTRTVHNTGACKVFKCTFAGCNYSTPYSNNILQRHVKRIHGDGGSTTAKRAARAQVKRKQAEAHEAEESAQEAEVDEESAHEQESEELESDS